MQKRIMIVEYEGLIANDIAAQLQKGGDDIAAISSSSEDALAIRARRPPIWFDGYSPEGQRTWN